MAHGAWGMGHSALRTAMALGACGIAQVLILCICIRTCTYPGVRLECDRIWRSCAIRVQEVMYSATRGCLFSILGVGRTLYAHVCTCVCVCVCRVGVCVCVHACVHGQYTHTYTHTHTHTHSPWRVHNAGQHANLVNSDSWSQPPPAPLTLSFSLLSSSLPLSPPVERLDDELTVTRTCINAGMALTQRWWQLSCGSTG